MKKSTTTLKRALKYPLELMSARWGEHTRRGPPRLWVLMYHRILPRTDARYATEEPGMIVTPETFHDHLKQLKELFTILPLSEWIMRHQQGQTLPDKACAITFDDGWADNYQYAMPLIKKEQVPVTLFAVSEMIGTRRRFWPNRIAHLLDKADPQQLAALNWLEVDYQSIITARKLGSKHLAEYISQVINHLKKHSDEQITLWATLAERELSIINETNDTLMTWHQLQAMSDSGLVEIGSHTCNHYRLRAGLAEATIADEIINSQKQLQEKLNKPVNLFCYPNGDVCEAAVKLVQKNYLGGVTTHRGINYCDSIDAAQILRIGMHQSISDTSTRLQARLSDWH